MTILKMKPCQLASLEYDIVENNPSQIRIRQVAVGKQTVREMIPCQHRTRQITVHESALIESSLGRCHCLPVKIPPLPILHNEI